MLYKLNFPLFFSVDIFSLLLIPSIICMFALIVHPLIVSLSHLLCSLLQNKFISALQKVIVMSKIVFVGSISREVTAADLRREFEGIGQIVRINVRNHYRPYAFVEYQSELAAVNAVRIVHGLNGWVVELSHAHNPDPCYLCKSYYFC